VIELEISRNGKFQSYNFTADLEWEIKD